MYYVYNEAGKDYGPFTLEELHRRVTSGEIALSSLARTSDVRTWKRISEIVPDDIKDYPKADPDVARASFPGSNQSVTVPSLATQRQAASRYADAYTTAGAVTGLSVVIKITGIGLGFIICFAAFIVGSNTPGLEGFIIGFGLIFGIVTGIVLYLIGILAGALGQLLKASLDSAVHSSPFLDENQKASTMRLTL